MTGEFWFDRAHNLVIDIGMTSGLVGLAAYLVFFGLILGFLLRQWMRAKERIDILLILGLLVAYFLQGLFTFDTINTDPILYLVLAYVCYMFFARSRTLRRQAPASHPPRENRPCGYGARLPWPACFLPLAFSYAVLRPIPIESAVAAGSGIHESAESANE